MTNGNREVFLAADLGASSGRLVAGSFDGSRIELEEVHRFDNGGVEIADHLYWDFLGLWNELQEGLSLAASKYQGIASLGVDTWGVDFGLLDSNDQLLANPRHYRDQSQEILETAFGIVPREEIFEQTGLQFMEFNSLYQLLSLKRENPQLLESAACLLMIPDLIHWVLSGEKVSEFTNATTTQMLDPRTGDWALSLLDRFSLPSGILQPVKAAGTVLGPLRRSVAETTGLRDVNVVLPGTHDTASAVMAVPVDAETQSSGRWCYISSGTWSLMGMEIPQPVINDRCLQLNFTNEGGVGQTVRLLKNIAGLWLVQQCRAAWASEQEYSWEQLVEMAGESDAGTCLIDPDDACFVAPRDMPTAIGNLMMQLVAAGAVASISEAREVVRASFEVEQYIPSDPDAWHEAADRFVGLLES